MEYTKANVTQLTTLSLQSNHIIDGYFEYSNKREIYTWSNRIHVIRSNLLDLRQNVVTQPD